MRRAGPPPERAGSDARAALARLEPPEGALQTFPDTDRYRCRFTIGSSSSDRVYMVSFDAAPRAGWWTCSCPGCVRHGSCKHLEAMGLRGRKSGKDLATLRRFGLAAGG